MFFRNMFKQKDYNIFIERLEMHEPTSSKIKDKRVDIEQTK